MLKSDIMKLQVVTLRKIPSGTGIQANIYPLLKECNITHRRLELIIFEKNLTNFLSEAMFQEDGNGPEG